MTQQDRQQFGTQQGGSPQQGGGAQGNVRQGGQGQQSQYAGAQGGQFGSRPGGAQAGRGGAQGQLGGQGQAGVQGQGGAMQQGGARAMTAGRGQHDASPWSGGFNGGPFALMRRISDEMDRIFESFGMSPASPRLFEQGGGSGGAQGLRTLWSPHIEVKQREGKLYIEADLPGIRKEDLDVRIEPEAVILQGHRQQETTRDEQGFYHTERSYGSFYRAIPLPEGVDTEQANATFRDGVLCVELPAPKQRERGRRLEIGDGGSSRTSIEGEATQGNSEGANASGHSTSSADHTTRSSGTS